MKDKDFCFPGLNAFVVIVLIVKVNELIKKNTKKNIKKIDRLFLGQTPETDCNMPCSGNSTQMCGGSCRANIYLIKKPITQGNIFFLIIKIYLFNSILISYQDHTWDVLKIM